MNDIAHKWTDKELTKLERRLKSEYTKAYNEMRKTMTEISEKILLNPDMALDEKMALMNKYNRLNNMCNQMSEILQDTNKQAQNFITKSLTNVYKTNYNFNAEMLGFSLIDNTAVKNVLTKEINPFTKISFKGNVDKDVLLRNIESEMIQSLLKGESIQSMANRLKNIAEKSLYNAIKIARTETTRIENSARQSVAEEGNKLGFNMWKRWYATPDERTREWHAEADGQEVPYDEPFIVGGEKLMYPADISMGASAQNVINCRCTIVSFVKVD